MNVRSIRRITNDARHNAFTGCCWFKGNLYVAFRQGDSHVCEFGRLVVLRSRDDGATWENVAVIRGPVDTRDAHLYTDRKRLYVVGFCYSKKAGNEILVSGCASSSNGDVWTAWKPYEGTGPAVMWRPQFFRGKHYCAGYLFDMERPGRKQRPEVNWYESIDGHRWRNVRTLHSGAEEPNECYLELRADCRATLLMRCETRPNNPYLLRSRYPFRTWTKQKLRDISIGGPCVWTVGNDVFFSARWRIEDKGRRIAHTAIFKVVKGRCQLEAVMPSGPSWDHSYMAAARHPDNDHRFALSFYSDAIAPTDPSINQWTHPDIYLADVVFDAEYLRDGFLVSGLQANVDLEIATCPDTDDTSLGFRKMKTGASNSDPDFLNVIGATHRRTGVVYIVRDIKTVGADKVRVHLGYDGPVKVWWNGQQVFTGTGKNPAIKDQTTITLRAHDGTNRLAIALDTNGGKAEGVFARWERV